MENFFERRLVNYSSGSEYCTSGSGGGSSGSRLPPRQRPAVSSRPPGSEHPSSQSGWFSNQFFGETASSSSSLYKSSYGRRGDDYHLSTYHHAAASRVESGAEGPSSSDGGPHGTRTRREPRRSPPVNYDHDSPPRARAAASERPLLRSFGNAPRSQQDRRPCQVSETSSGFSSRRRPPEERRREVIAQGGSFNDHHPFYEVEEYEREWSEASTAHERELRNRERTRRLARTQAASPFDENHSNVQSCVNSASSPDSGSSPHALGAAEHHHHTDLNRGAGGLLLDQNRELHSAEAGRTGARRPPASSGMQASRGLPSLTAPPGMGGGGAPPRTLMEPRSVRAARASSDAGENNDLVPPPEQQWIHNNNNGNEQPQNTRGPFTGARFANRSDASVPSDPQAQRYRALYEDTIQSALGSRENQLPTESELQPTTDSNAENNNYNGKADARQPPNNGHPRRRSGGPAYVSFSEEGKMQIFRNSSESPRKGNEEDGSDETRPLLEKADEQPEREPKLFASAEHSSPDQSAKRRQRSKTREPKIVDKRTRLCGFCTCLKMGCACCMPGHCCGWFCCVCSQCCRAPEPQVQIRDMDCEDIDLNLDGRGHEQRDEVTYTSIIISRLRIKYY